MKGYVFLIVCLLGMFGEKVTSIPSGFTTESDRNDQDVEIHQTSHEQDQDAVSDTSKNKFIAENYRKICKYHICGDGHCCCDDYYTAVCKGSLSYIPKLPSNTSRLYYENNELRDWNKNTFENVSNIEELLLRKNGLRNCANDTFTSLKSLKQLNISDENVTKEIISTCLGSISSTHIVSLNLEFNNISGERTGGIFSKLKRSPVSHISMNHTDLQVFNQSEYRELTNIQFLSFLSCWIQIVTLGCPLKKLTQLIFSSNSITQFPKFCNGGKAMFPNLTILRLDSNFIRYLPSDGFHCMKNLVEISIAQNPLLGIKPNTFSKLPFLKKIIMNYVSHMSKDRKFIIQKYAFNSSSLTHLYLNGLNLPQDLVQIDQDAFQACRNLQVLYISDHRFNNFSEKKFDKLFNGMEKLKELSLTNTKIGFLPQIVSHSMPMLETLYADYNEITGWTNRYFDSLVSLKRLNLCCNELSTVNKSSFSLSTLKKLISLDLSDNPYSCTCAALLWLTKLSKSKAFTSKLQYFPGYYKCSSPRELEGEMITKTHISDKYCLLNSHVSLLIINICFIAVFLVSLASVVYRYRWHIRYRLYMLRYYYTRYQRLIHEGSEYKYDVYLSCCDDDLSFVMNVLLLHLEQTMGLRVFLPTRDGLGQTSMGCSTGNIDSCKRVVICVSNAYSIDNYCEFETELACDRVINERRDLMIVILLEEVHISRMTKTLHKVLNVDDYIKWDDNGESIDMFWQKLTRFLTEPLEFRQ